MLKKITLAAVCVLALSACDEKSSSGGKEIASQEQSPKSFVSETALYLPGGVGLEFGRKPIHVELREDEYSKLKISTYEFDESPEEVDKSIAFVVENAGYVRTLHEPGTDKLSVSYRKQGENPVLTRYLSRVRDGVNRTILVISWRFK